MCSHSKPAVTLLCLSVIVHDPIQLLHASACSMQLNPKSYMSK
jgi:hypothetical protein